MPKKYPVRGSAREAKSIVVKHFAYRKPKRVEYVRVCPRCDEELSGNGSQLLPYTCKCGIWQYRWMEADWELREKV